MKPSIRSDRPQTRSARPLRCDPLDWSGGGPSGTAENITRQGFTYQTVLGRMGLNHMNGRVQDAISGTFISPDPYIPDSLNTQAFNRYAYVYNNPLKYTDPSGFEPSPDGPCQTLDLFGCGGFIPGWFLLGPGTADDEFLACFARGHCRGAQFGQNYNPKVAPRTALVQMDKRQVARVDVVAVLAHEMSERLRAIAMLVVAVSGLHFPIVDDVRVRVTGGGELVACTVGDLALIGSDLLCGVAEDLEAARAYIRAFHCGLVHLLL
jgi:RHS repeat-associated protein